MFRSKYVILLSVVSMVVLMGMVIAAVPNAPKPPKPKEVDATNYTESGSDTLTNDIDGNAGTASALAANPSDCAAGSYALGVDASGNAQGCTVDADTQYGGADFALSDQSCVVGQVVTGVDAGGNVTCGDDSAEIGIYSFICPGCDLAGISLPGVDLSNAWLRGTIFATRKPQPSTRL